MIAPWMLYSLTVGALIGTAALAGHYSCRALRLPVRWIWLAAMVGTVMLSAVALIRLLTVEAPAVASAEVHVLAESMAVSDAARTSPGAALAGAAGRMMKEAVNRMYAAAAAVRGSGDYLAGAWLIASAFLLLLFTGTMTRLRRARRGWRRHRIDDTSVLVSRETGPAIVGLLRPCIVVPGWLLAQPAERQRLVVRHEDEHRNAGDHVMLAVACVLVCVLPWNAALWWMLLRLRLAVELDCDARVLRSGAVARSYGALLLEIAAHTRSFPFSAPALADSRTHLERRIIAMTEKNRTPRRTRAAAAGLSALVLMTAACVTELPTAAAIDEMDATRARAEAEQAGFLVALESDESPLYIVDGVVVPEQVARDVPADEISRIEVVKAKAALRAYGERGANGVVNIATRSASNADEGATRRREAVRSSSFTATARLSEAKAPLGVPVAGEETVDGVRQTTGKVMRLRATANTRAGDPLYIVDGVIISEKFSLSSVPPESIDRIEVLKGAAAQKLYDNARAANGVILITTKAGGR